MRTTASQMLAITAMVVSTVCLSPNAWADGDPAAPPSQWTITGSAAVASQYRFRGISQSDNRPVVQGAITVSHASGFYVSTWGSSASAVDSPVNIGGTEIDVYGGYTHAIGKSGLTFDGGLYGYLYPGAPNGNYYEIYGSLTETIGPVSGKVGANFAPPQRVFDYNWTSTERHNMYVYAELSGSIPNTPITLHSHVAHTGGGFDFAKDYVDYNVGATVKWKRLAFDLSLVGTNISRSDFAKSGLASDGEGGVDPDKLEAFYRTGKPVAVVSVTASF
jgi:uncharacterized protein (TIGR02001 family)